MKSFIRWVSQERSKIWKNRSYWFRVSILLGLGICAEHFLDHSRVMLGFRYHLYQLQTDRLSPESEPGLNTMFVAIDDAAFWRGDFARRLPLKRLVLAKLVKAVSDANPTSIVIDFDFRSPTPTANNPSSLDYQMETSALLEALRDVAGKIPLIVPISLDRKGNSSLSVQPDIFTDFTFGAAAHNIHRGHILFDYDLRKIPSCVPIGPKSVDSLSLAMLQATYPEKYEQLAHPKRDGTCTPDSTIDLQFGRFISADTFNRRTLSATSVLEGDQKALQALARKVVIICATWHTHSEGMGPAVDAHLSPAGEIPGGFVHANYYEAMIANHYYNSTSTRFTYALEVFLVLFSAQKILERNSFAHRLIWALVPAMVMVVASYLVLQNIGAFFDCFIPVVVLLAHIILDHIWEWRSSAKKYKECRCRFSVNDAFGEQ